jgi:hypothetical protein
MNEIDVDRSTVQVASGRSPVNHSQTKTTATSNRHTARRRAEMCTGISVQTVEPARGTTRSTRLYSLTLQATRVGRKPESCTTLST